MADFKDIKFTGADIIKLAGLVLMLGSMWADLKSDLIKHKEQQKLIEYRIAQLEKQTK